MRFKKYSGFALPTILIASIIMLTVLTVTMASISAILASIKAQGYNQMAQDASSAGLRYAESCLRQSDGVVTWSDNSPLTPATDCYGNVMGGIDCANTSSATDPKCFLSSQTNADGATYFTSFSVGTPDYPNPGKYANLHSNGLVYLISLSRDSIWQTYSQISTEKVKASPKVVTNGLVLNLDADNTTVSSSWDDSSNYSGNATLVNNPSVSVDNSTNSVVFNGTNYATFHASDLTNATTIDMWAKIGSADSKMMFGWNVYSMWHMSGALGYNTGVGDIYGLSSSTVSSLGLVGKWMHYTFIMYSDRSYTNNAIYINGNSQTLSQIAGSEGDSTRKTFNSGNGCIASWCSDTNYLMPMSVGSFRVYNRALSAAEIHTNFDNTRGRYGL